MKERHSYWFGMWKRFQEVINYLLVSCFCGFITGGTYFDLFNSHTNLLSVAYCGKDVILSETNMFTVFLPGLE